MTAWLCFSKLSTKPIRRLCANGGQIEKAIQWFNFWFAVALLVGLTVFFGLVQSIEGALQVYKAYHPSPSP
jgi:hypothetical protein